MVVTMIASIIGLIILFNFNQCVLTGEVESIRAEEEKNHNEVLTRYLKAAITGALSNLFPNVTNQEQTEAEKLLSEACPLYDPPLPQTLEQLDAKICVVHKERGEKLYAYARKRFPTHVITQIAVRLSMNSYGSRNDEICKDKESRSDFVKHAALINQHVNGLHVARNKFIDNTLSLVHSNTTATKVALLCCSYWSFKAGLINALPTQQLKDYYAESLKKYDGDTTRYLCLYHSEGSQACAQLVIPPLPTNVTRFTSSLMAMLESVAKITQIAL